MEKTFNNRLDKFLEINDILSNNQYGFRNNSTTCHALIDLHEQLTKSIDDKLCTIGVFLDLKKAFDTIDHSLLLQKLNRYGIRGIANSWLTSYLKERSQYVFYNNENSDAMNICCGVPQGSILGPKLFLLYINDMVNVSKIFKFIIFADDTNLFCTSKDIMSLSVTICNELMKLKKWFALNKLSLNITKTNYMIFCKTKYKDNIQISIGNKLIDKVSETKFLGVIIDDQLNWQSHIKQIVTKLHKNYYIIKKASRSMASLTMLYNSLCLPYMLYCCEIWGRASAYLLNKITLLQKKMIRLVHKAFYREHRKPLFKLSNILMFSDLLQYAMSILMFKAFHNLLPANIQNIFKIHINIRSSRRQNMFSINYSHTNLRRHCTSNVGKRLWNDLPVDLKNIASIYLFKKNMKFIFLQGY